MAKKGFPIGIQTLSEIREEGMYYVDKTSYAEMLARKGRGKHFFLSRPRRFGKSLFVDTLKELFEGNEPLFRGLAVHDRWNWSERHPVIRLDFSSGDFTEKGVLEESVDKQLSGYEEMAELTSKYTKPSVRLWQLIEHCARKTGKKVVLLVDEYDKPILDTLGDKNLASSRQRFLRGFYSVIKQAEADIRLTFITGVSRFPRVSLFSDVNNLKDITLIPRFSSICGYTESELDDVFSRELRGLDREEIREWYNGYSWLGKEKVYNPFTILQVLDERMVEAWWFETSTPTFLVEEIRRSGWLPLEHKNITLRASDLSASDISKLKRETLLFQTGYLTIARRLKQGGVTLYRMEVPNREVRQSLNEVLMDNFMSDSETSIGTQLEQLRMVLRSADLKGLERQLRSFFAGIPHQWHTRGKVSEYEAYFACAVYGFFAGAGLDLRVEDSTSEGRIDMTVVEPNAVYLFEFKVNKGDSSSGALDQLRKKRYAGKYRGLNRPIHLVGVEFSSRKRNIEVFETALA